MDNLKSLDLENGLRNNLIKLFTISLIMASKIFKCILGKVCNGLNEPFVAHDVIDCLRKSKPFLAKHAIDPKNKKKESLWKTIFHKTRSGEIYH